MTSIRGSLYTRSRSAISMGLGRWPSTWSDWGIGESLIWATSSAINRTRNGLRAIGRLWTQPGFRFIRSWWFMATANRKPPCERWIGCWRCPILRPRCAATTICRLWARCGRFGCTDCACRKIFPWRASMICSSRPTPSPR